MKPIMITLMYLTFGGDIKLDTFEKQKKTFMSNHYYHMYKGKRVIGYVCGGDEPK